jgi:maleate isomerase
MKHVTKEELDAMIGDSERCALELSDARADVIAYACLVAIMSQGVGYHHTVERHLARAAERNGAPAPVVSSAGALVRGIKAMGCTRIALVTPYMKPLTQLVVEYLNDAGIEVVDAISLEIPDNLAVARHDPMLLPGIAGRLHLNDAQAVVLSACVQMRSLPAIQIAEEQLELPVLSAAVATAYDVLDHLGLKPVAPRAGALLGGRLTVAA